MGFERCHYATVRREWVSIGQSVNRLRCLRFSSFLVVGGGLFLLAVGGYAFWRLIRLIGLWPAQAIVAVLFMVSHLTPGGYSFLPALIGNVTGSVLYGAAFVRARGLAAPIALHTGWNIAQHLLLSPLDPSATPFVPTFPHIATTRKYATILAIVGAVMVTVTVLIVRSQNITRPASQ